MAVLDLTVRVCAQSTQNNHMNTKKQHGKDTQVKRIFKQVKAEEAARKAARDAARNPAAAAEAAKQSKAAQAAAKFRQKAGFKKDQSHVPPRNFAPFNEAEKFR